MSGQRLVFVVAVSREQVSDEVYARLSRAVERTGGNFASTNRVSERIKNREDFAEPCVVFEPDRAALSTLKQECEAYGLTWLELQPGSNLEFLFLAGLY
jgi:hypothetical protein